MAEQEADPLDAERDQFIPIRKSDILDALAAHGDLGDAAEREKFRNLCTLLGAVFHYEYFDELERLRDDYYYFNPEIDDPAHLAPDELERRYAEFVNLLATALMAANFRELPARELADTHDDRVTLRVAIETPDEHYDEVRFFRRGHHREIVEVPSWFGLRKQKVEASIYDHVVILVKVKPARAFESRRARKRLARAHLRPGSVLIKYFRNIPRGDLSMLFPGVRVVMSMFDKLVLGVPALTAGIPLLLNLVPTITVLFVVMGFYLGVTGAVRDDDMRKAFAALSGLAALGGFGMRQWVRYQRQSLKYQIEISENVYYRNVTNNAGILDYLVGAAEEQECKEAFLAYYFLLHAAEPLEQNALDARIESWLKERFRLDIDFQIGDALDKLARLGLLRRNDRGRLAVVGIDEALRLLDERWDGFFPFANAQRA